MNTKWRYLTSYALCNVLMACGNVAQSVPKSVGGGSNPEPAISVQLNDLWNQSFASDTVHVVDARKFTAPSAVYAVSGTYGGSNPAQFLRARILVHNDVCEYASTGINDYTLVLQSCSYGGGVFQLPDDTYIELSNYDAPGLLLEAHFTLTR